MPDVPNFCLKKWRGRREEERLEENEKSRLNLGAICENICGAFKKSRGGGGGEGKEERGKKESLKIKLGNWSPLA